MSRPLAVAVGSLGVPASFAAYRYARVMERQGKLPTTNLAFFSESEDQHKQRVLVIGGGVVGVTCAYKLAKSGKQVVVLEPRSAPGKECSACAAGGMQKSNPVVDRGTWMAVLQSMFPLPTWLGGSGETYRFFHLHYSQTLSDPFFLRWLYTFTHTSIFPDDDQQDKRVEQLKFTKYAVDDLLKMMRDQRDNMAKVSGYNTRGSVNVSYDPPIDVVKEKKPEEEEKSGSPASGMSYEPCRKLSGPELFEVEPSLSLMTVPPTSANYEHASGSANSERFTQELAKRCVQDEKLDVAIEYNTCVKGVSTIISDKGKPQISHLHTNRGVIEVQKDVKVVVAAGAWTSHVLALMDLYAPVYPLKGYAMTVSAKEALQSNPNLKAEDLPSRIVSDKYLYTSRLGDDIRITSIGEFSGWNTSPDPDVDKEFRRESLSRMPHLTDLINKAKTYCGHRPYISDGLLLLGQIPSHENLFVSVGPGSNGWKLAMGSGDIIDRLVDGQTEEKIEQDCGFNIKALAPAGRVLPAPFFSKLCRIRWDI
mmetsp:Transcript_5600/g.8598  ORF Transcript_5600/g.8598 Transcript_5600/m.8598 type:complete len:535 (-) Transcript_5600:198-1802(-)|eukprot:CAMPEP_0195290166 /NCGR_PEP_ID=MMETSP0707-20130614/6141_1 /TAXON_ID=33640 /ORGANISM="Asterionellopsis glacialis, Strain CCMP134" /LENGTH=534 /DNA_ID=CAMNT_0040350257 /DNA_START=28 /DNA_END=1632 /DNA_ORIENTATION=-